MSKIFVKFFISFIINVLANESVSIKIDTFAIRKPINQRYMKTGKICFISSFLWILAAIQLMAQQSQMAPLPIDPKVRYGTLSNGLTYYIRHNEQPKDRADFFIAQNVGSMQEEENQRGLAHFLEHMAFNGTRNFPEHTMDEYTESIGMRGGENFNAYTSFDETVYMIMNAPVERRGVIDSCLLILHDWSGFISLEDSAIEKERGVIREEWRTRQDAQARLWEQQLPAMIPDNKYAHRMPIGTIDVIENFKPEELRAYYKKWYRPDLQAIVIVGDVNVDEVEADIKRIFTDIPLPVNAAPRLYQNVADNEEPIVSIAKDKEASNMILSIYFKHDKMPRELYATPAGIIKDYMVNIIISMINERFEEILQKGNPPFVAAQASDGDYMVTKTKEAFSVAALVKDDDIKEAMDALVNEAERMRQYGFTASEYERAKINIVKQYESAFNEREKQQNRAYTNEYVRHFTDGGYIPGIETEYAMISQLASAVPLEEVNSYAHNLVSDQNIVISLTGPDKPGMQYPTDQQLLSDFVNAQQMPVQAYVENVSTEPLISKIPAPGKITSCIKDSLFDATVMTLSNGLKVIVKHTDFKKDDILFTATSPGGSSLFGDKDIYNLKVFNDVITLGGLGNFSSTELMKRLPGKKVSCTPSLGVNTENMNGFSSPKDIETLFQLIYLNFTANRSDEEAYTSFENRMLAQLKNLELNPMVAFSDSLSSAIYMNNPRAERLKPADFEFISYSRIMEMYKERFSDAAGFVFTFVGNISPDSIKPFVEQYLATLPASGKIQNPDLKHVPEIRKGLYTNIFNRKLEVPKSSVVDFYSGEMSYSLENNIKATLFKQVLDLVFMEKIREDEGGTYGVQTSASISYFPEGRTFLQIYFDTDPAKRVRMNEIIYQELQNMAEKGPRQEDLQKSLDNLTKRYAERLQENVYWLTILDSYYCRGYNGYTDYLKTLNQMTLEQIRLFAKTLLDQNNRIEVVMEP